MEGQARRKDLRVMGPAEQLAELDHEGERHIEVEGLLVTQEGVEGLPLWAVDHKEQALPRV